MDFPKFIERMFSSFPIDKPCPLCYPFPKHNENGVKGCIANPEHRADEVWLSGLARGLVLAAGFWV